MLESHAIDPFAHGQPSAYQWKERDIKIGVLGLNSLALTIPFQGCLWVIMSPGLQRFMIKQKQQSLTRPRRWELF